MSTPLVKNGGPAREREPARRGDHREGIHRLIGAESSAVPLGEGLTDDAAALVHTRALAAAALPPGGPR